MAPQCVRWPLEPFPGAFSERGSLQAERSIRALLQLLSHLLFSIPACPTGPGLKVLPSGQLHLLRASLADAGSYLCVARNPSGTAMGRTRLIVQGKAGVVAPLLTWSSARSPCSSLLHPWHVAEMWLPARCPQHRSV